MTIDRPTTLPPAWAEGLLRLVLAAEDRESISGDLLEEYRESIVPARGAAANRWYLRQVARYVVNATWLWAVLFASAFLARTAYDWRMPTTDFALRSAVLTWTHAATLFAAAAWAAWRSHSVAAGVLTAIVTSQISAVISAAGAALLFAAWHDPVTRAAIAGSGGLGEVFVLPFMMIVPAVIVGTAGAVLGKALSAVYGWSSANTKSA